MSTLRTEFAAQARLAAPVVLVNLGMMGMAAVDAAFMGHHSTLGLAAVSMGHSLLWVPASFGIGVLLALDTLVSQAFGARDERGVARALQRGVLLSFVLAVPLGLVLLGAEEILLGLGQRPDMVAVAAPYTLITALGLPAIFLWVTLRQTLQALGNLRVIVFVALGANLLNAALDHWLIFGGLGVPPLGARGCAWATVACNYLMPALLITFAWGRLGPRLWPLAERVFKPAPLLRLLGLGLPIGFTVALEAGAFNAVTFIMGHLGDTEVAANRAVLILASTSFMVPLGLSTAAAVRVGRFVGARDHAAVRRAARVSLTSTAVLMVLFAATMLALREQFARLFTNDPAVALLAMGLIPLAAAFQLVDGLQIVSAGILRGTGETRWPLLANLVAYWFVALPAGAWWALRAGGGPQALWWALGGGLGVVAVVLLLTVRRRLARPVDRVDLDRDGAPAGASGQDSGEAAGIESGAADMGV